MIRFSGQEMEMRRPDWPSSGFSVFLLPNMERPHAFLLTLADAIEVGRRAETEGSQVRIVRHRKANEGPLTVKGAEIKQRLDRSARALRKRRSPQR